MATCTVVSMCVDHIPRTFSNDQQLSHCSDPGRGSLSLAAMPPPSPTREEQLLAWKKGNPSAHKFEGQRRRSSMQTTSAEFERKQTTTATYTEQFLKRRRSQQGLTGSANPHVNGNRRIERRRSSEDLSTSSDHLFSDPRPLLQEENSHQENGHQENGHQAVATTVEKTNEKVVAAVSGTGIPLNDDTYGTIDAVSKVNVTKKRKRSTVVMTLVAGVAVTVTVVSGLAICQMYPSSSAAESIRFVAERAEEGAYLLLIEVRKGMVAYVDVVRTKSMALLQSKVMQETARATEELVSSRFTEIVTMLMENIRLQLRISVSTLVDAVRMSVEWMQSYLRIVFERIEYMLVVERAQIALLSLVEALKEWTMLSLDQVFEWTGLKESAIDVNLPSDNFLAPLATHQAAIQNIGKVLIAQESQALQDVKRFEKRRVTIVSDTNSIIADTRTITLESIVDVKMAALEFIEMRIKKLEEHYARVFDQALKDYERTSQQVEKEGGTGFLSEIAAENQVPLDVTSTFRQSLMPHDNPVDDKPMDNDEPPDEGTIKHQTDVQLVKEEKLLEMITEAPVLTEQGSSEAISSGIKGKTQLVAELARGDALTVELMETQGKEHDFYNEAMESEHVVEEQIGIAADLTAKDRPTIELPVPVVKTPNSLEDDGGQITAQVAEEKLLTIELESTEKEEVVDTEKEVYVTEVLMDFGNDVLEIERTELKVMEQLEMHNQSEVDTSKQKVEHQQEERAEAHFRVPVDRTDVDLVVKLDNQAGENTDMVNQLHPEVRSRVAVQPKNEEESGVDSQKIHKIELMQEEKYSQVHQTIVLADETEIEVQSEELKAETMVKVKWDANEAAEAVVADVQRVEEEELVRLRSQDEAVRENNVQESDAASNNDDQQESTRNLFLEEEMNAASLSETDILEIERVVVAKEIQELDQLEQVLLQEEDERFRVQEELRKIAEKEEIWLHSEHAPAEGKVSQDGVVFDQPIAATIDVIDTPEVVVDSRSDIWRSNLDSPATALPSTALTQIGLLSVVFLSFAMLTVYLLWTRHRKWSLLARAPRRRRRWQRLADMNESDTEEVVLLPDDSSDEEDGTDLAAPKESHLEVGEVMSSAEVKTTVMLSSGEEEEEETNEDHESSEENEKEVDEFDVVTTRSRSAVIERVQTANYTVGHPATPTSDASGERSDTAITTPPASRQKTPDTSQRMTRRQRQEIRT